jgi:hypothetical protein
MMNRVILAAAFALALGSASAIAQTSGTGTPGAATGGASGVQMSSAECQALWSKANPGGTGSLTQTQAQPYVTSFSQVDTDGDGQISNAEFMSACQAGHVRDTATTGAGTGSTGTGTTGTTGTGTKQ